MKRLIMIEIDADSMDCGRCKYRSQAWCDAFSVALRDAPMGGVWGRAKECAEAERRARSAS